MLTGLFSCRCCVIHWEKGKLDLSLRDSRLGGEVKVRDPEIQGLEDLKDGQLVRGYVKAVTDVGVFIR